ncbi:uncharacterized protein LY89DRAFT_288737 [Mollisia scopiformis]|uniref:Ubiquitin-like protease family profile domain-containing protein n=1 Tax=Mollisia scopiformis TaxID=149040 RepID=A0A132BAR6_MOLSC|nr:uncharacterized protein LY89DRAFT_288737 [Mollisia scopiformis]KUJ09481.1 hypothetical protein LY89DRAFT_288737 [Mollisia scopiformis]
MVHYLHKALFGINTISEFCSLQAFRSNPHLQVEMTSTNGTGIVHPLATLTAAARATVERQILDPIPASVEKYWNTCRDELSVTWDRKNLADPVQQYTYTQLYDLDRTKKFDPSKIVDVDLNQIAVRKPEYAFNWNDFGTIINSRTRPDTIATQSDGDKEAMRNTISIPLTEAYIRLVCDYANGVRDKAERAVGSTAPPRISCHCMLQSSWQPLRDAALARDPYATIAQQILTQQGITQQTFAEMDFLFLPHLRPDLDDAGGEHYTLLGFAPRQKYAFWINSAEPKTPSDDPDVDLPIQEYEAYMRDSLLAILFCLVPDHDERESWEVNLDYCGNEDKTLRKAVRQRDTYNCGAYVCTNALLLAFGYNLTSFDARDIDQFRKPRMFAELLNGGFSGLYQYDLIEFPAPRTDTDPSPSYDEAIEAREDWETGL